MMAVNVPARAGIESVRESTSSSFQGGEVNAFTRINELIMLMKKLNIEMRDVLRGFHDDMQKIAFEKQVTGYQTKQDGIIKTHESALATSCAQIGFGLAGLVGAGVGFFGNQLWSTVASSLGTTGQGVAGVFSANLTMDAQQTNLLGEFQTATADNLQKTLATTAERASEASRQLREATRELLALYERLSNAVQLRAR
ncbi:hypothetical protein [Pseudomonas zeae]|uniref:hypothetical protein n=1 Tax=Pseudomonas zeae TaxID=2745510 RepID=UPI0039E10EE4